MAANEPKLVKSDGEWREQLTPAQYEVLRKAGTEPPFSGEYVYNKASGDYRCAACGEGRGQLTPAQYEVLRRAGTEPPFSGEYVYNKASGDYRCAACGAMLFAADTKFDSGTGWPSFTEPAVAGAV